MYWPHTSFLKGRATVIKWRWQSCSHFPPFSSLLTARCCATWRPPGGCNCSVNTRALTKQCICSHPVSAGGRATWFQFKQIYSMSYQLLSCSSDLRLTVWPAHSAPRRHRGSCPVKTQSGESTFLFGLWAIGGQPTPCLFCHNKDIPRGKVEH